tara:strand:+ start:631 stop:1053 length:423 start_codon:yes stop_codon:yes gene_type:complete
MKSLHLESTNITPEFLFDVETLTLSLKGVSEIGEENSYYTTITNFIDEIEAGKPLRLTCEFDFDVLCRKSKRGLLFFLLRLKDLQTNCGTQLIVDWVCNPDEDLIKSIGLNLDYMVRLKMNFIEKELPENKVEEVGELVF